MITEAGASSAQKQRVSRADLLVGVGVFSANVVLRILTAGRAGLSLDEAASVWYCGQEWPAFAEFLGRDATPPLFSLMLRGWTSLFGISEFVVRLPSVVATSVTAAVVYFFGTRWMGRRTGLLAAVIFSLSPLQMAMSQTTRSYAIAACFAAISMYFFVGFLRNGNRWAAAGLVLADLAILYSNYVAGLLLVARIAALPFLGPLGRRRLPSFVALQVLVLFAFIPGLARIDANQVDEPGRWFDSPGVGSLWSMWSAVCGNQALAVCFAAILVGGIIAAAVGHRKLELQPAWTFAAWLSWGVGSIAFAWVISQWIPVFVPRYLAFAGAGVALSVAGAFTLLTTGRDRGPTWVGAAVILCLSVSAFKPSAPVIEDWPAAAEWIEKHRKSDTKIIVSAGYQCRTLIYALNRDLFLQYRSPHRVWFEREGLICVNTVDQEILASLNTEHLLLVQSHARDVDPENTTAKVIENTYRRIERHELSGITIGAYNRVTVVPCP